MMGCHMSHMLLMNAMQIVASILILLSSMHDINTTSFSANLDRMGNLMSWLELVVNFICAGTMEMIVINSGLMAISLAWIGNTPVHFSCGSLPVSYLALFDGHAPSLASLLFSCLIGSLAPLPLALRNSPCSHA
jgi:hypothetical protein